MASFGSTVRVEGLPKLSRLIREADDDLDLFMREGLYEIGEMVARDVRDKYRPYSGVGADAVETKIRKAGYVIVAQTLRRGRDMNRRRSNFGGLMMRKAFLPSLGANEEKAAEAANLLLDRVAAKFNTEAVV